MFYCTGRLSLWLWHDILFGTTLTLFVTHVFHNNQNKNNHSPRLPDRRSSLIFCESSVTFLPGKYFTPFLLFVPCLFIKNGRLPRWGRMLLNWGIGRASLSEHWAGYRTANKQERLHVWDLCVKKTRWQKRS